MINAIATKLSIGALAILVGGGGGALVYENCGPESGLSAGLTVMPQTVHNTSWYVGHPDILRQDEGRCAGDAATISRAACQNVASADNQLGISEMENAAAQDGQSGETGKRAN